ncbi:MAG: AmmeMemoRadiSam system protein B [Gammaproteobacteria bacterium]|nr:AmmeMemoRadiSam system protein B [Gammaproteobacteria bacterium]
MRVREPAVAGYFYPAQAERLRAEVQTCLCGLSQAATAPKAIVAPHAGYVYSGRVAGHAYAALGHHCYARVVLLGPCHRVYVDGLALPTVEAFRTPLGLVPLDTAAMARIDGLAQVCRNDDAHALEHSLEVQLPFLQQVLEGFLLVPLAVGSASPAAVAGVLAALVDDGTLIVVSTDLSHYHGYAEARRLDAYTTTAIEQLRTAAIGPEQACGYAPLNGTLEFARAHDWQVTALMTANSGDTAGPRDRVVGYGAYLMAAPATSARS